MAPYVALLRPVDRCVCALRGHKYSNQAVQALPLPLPTPSCFPALRLLCRLVSAAAAACASASSSYRPETVMMGQLGRLVDGIKSKLRAGGGRKAAAVGYDKVEKTDSMRVEIRSREARKLIAKNLVAVDNVARARSNKRFFLAF